MKWTLPLGRIAGIPIQVHTTFALLLGWIALMHWLAAGTAAAVVSGVLFIVAVFGCVLLHELGHALAARRYGIGTRDITLLPIGGIARLERMPERPSQELWVAFAGPAVNVVIAAALFGWLVITDTLAPLQSLAVASGPFAERLMVVNLFLVVFNMLPAFPMDGGRILRAFLAMRLEYAKATRIAATVGQSSAILFGIVGLFVNPLLLLIAVFVWFGAAQESAAAQARATLGGIPVRAAMETDFRTLRTSDTLQHAIQHVLAGSQAEFPVLDGDRLVGVLTHRKLLETLATSGAEGTVEDALEESTLTVSPGDMIDVAMQRMQTLCAPVAGVLEAGRLVGILTVSNIAEFISFRQVLSDRAGIGPARQGDLDGPELSTARG